MIQFVFIFLFTITRAWWNPGHLITARVAYDFLQKEQPEIITDVNTKLDFLKISDPGWTNSEKNYPFVECATFADEIKHKGGSYQEEWHFVDFPYLDEDQNIKDFPNFVFKPYNITLVVPQIIDYLVGQGDIDDMYAVQQIRENSWHNATENDNKSTALRLLIHYIGDIHQPLHATSRVDSNYPAGDRGGNSYPLKQKDGEPKVNELHALWDSVVYKFGEDYTLPLSKSNWDVLGGISSRLRSNYTIDPSDYLPLKIKQWALESFHWSGEKVYKDILENSVPTNEYVEDRQKLAEKQLVLGGRRLANTLKYIFTNPRKYHRNIVKRKF